MTIGKHRYTWIAGLGLIAAANAVALAGAWYNRSGEPDAVMRLSQREFSMRGEWGPRHENSGVSISMKWRVAAGDRPGRPAGYFSGDGYNGESPSWLGREKLAALGIDVDAGARACERMMTRSALLVLEMNGPAYQEALDDARARNEQAQRESQAAPDNKQLVEQAKAAAAMLVSEQESQSRLFVVDVGLDAATLRSRYPDRGRYATVLGKLSFNCPERGGQVRAYVAGVLVDRLNVPVQFQSAVGSSGTLEGTRPQGRPYTVEVSFGRRLEPWISGAGS